MEGGECAADSYFVIILTMWDFDSQEEDTISSHCIFEGEYTANNQGNTPL